MIRAGSCATLPAEALFRPLAGHDPVDNVNVHILDKARIGHIHFKVLRDLASQTTLFIKKALAVPIKGRRVCRCSTALWRFKLLRADPRCLIRVGADVCTSHFTSRLNETI